MVNAMEWQKQLQLQNQRNAGNNGEMMYAKVMTDEQLETLRKQIAAYATICEQLVEMHKTHSAQQDGFKLGNIYDPLMVSASQKLNPRQRWTPTPVQLQILERIFDQGIGAPSKDKIKEITAELTQHGQITETNVYNWFQNRRARWKRKQLSEKGTSNNAESEVETEVDSSKDKKTKPVEFQSQQSVTTVAAKNMRFQNPDLQYLNPEANKSDSIFPPDGGLTSTSNFGPEPVFDGSEYLAGKMDAADGYLYPEPEDYMTG